MQRIQPVLGVALLLALVACAAEAPPTTPTPPPTETASPASPFDPALLDRSWNVLFVGADHNAARAARGDAISTDALMLASLSADQSMLTLVSLPRDTVDLPLPGGETWDRKINALYSERGIDALVEAMQLTFGVPIDAYVAMDMDDFTRLVGAVGTIEVAPASPLVDPIVDLNLEAGRQEIGDVDVNGYVRTRVDQDYGRMGRQQEVIVALVERLIDPETDLDLAVVLASLDSLETDLALADLPTLLELARRARDARVQGLIIEPPLITFEGDRGDGRGYVLEPDLEAIRVAVAELIATE